MHDGINIQFSESDKIIRNYQSGELKGKRLVYLLQNKSGLGARMSAKKLVKILAKKRYWTYGSHNINSDDKNMHYTIEASGYRGIHLQTDSNGVIWRITDFYKSDLAEGPAPWERSNI